MKEDKVMLKPTVPKGSDNDDVNDDDEDDNDAIPTIENKHIH